MSICAQFAKMSVDSVLIDQCKLPCVLLACKDIPAVTVQRVATSQTPISSFIKTISSHNEHFYAALVQLGYFTCEGRQPVINRH